MVQERAEHQEELNDTLDRLEACDSERLILSNILDESRKRMQDPIP